MPGQAGVAGSAGRVDVGGRIPNLEAQIVDAAAAPPEVAARHAAIPLAFVIGADAIVEGELLVDLPRILRIEGPLVESDLIDRDRTLLLVVADAAKQKIGDYVRSEE